MTNTKVQQVTVTHLYEGQRIDNYLVRQLKGVPKSKVYRIIRKGEVRVNSKRIKPDYRLCEGDVIRIPPINMAEKSNPTIKSQWHWQELTLYEDAELLIINKPSGLAVHGGTGESYGLIELFRYQRSDLEYLELAHRIDKYTSGCLVLAKTPDTLKALHQLWLAGEVHKVYLTFVKGLLREEEYLVTSPLARMTDTSGDRKMREHEEGKVSETIFRPLALYTEGTLLEALPLSGRTHQIRAHASLEGFPVAGDEKYGEREYNRKMRQQGLKRLFLHAYEIEFTLNGEEHYFQAPLPDELVAFLDGIGK